MNDLSRPDASRLPHPPQDQAALISRLKATVEAQAALIRKHEAALLHNKITFETASKAAGIGIWECRLSDSFLNWSDIVYDIFDLPRGSSLHRKEIDKCYSEASAKELHLRRSRAIEERTGFSLDAEITTCKGNGRWIRITATVECENGVPVRIFGMKQDITQEKILGDRTRYLAEFDLLTGLPNRCQFETAFSGMMEAQNRLGALLLVDLDGFKQVNDTFGHSEGDECLKEAAFRLRTACAGAELVARVGGDEFAVLLGPGLGAQAAAEMAKRIVEALSWTVTHDGMTISLSASAGIANSEPCHPSQLFKKADMALYMAKNSGRSTYRVCPAAAEPLDGVSVAA